MSKALKIDNKCDDKVVALVNNFLYFLSIEKKYSGNTINSYRIDIFYFLDFLYQFKEKKLAKGDLEKFLLSTKYETSIKGKSLVFISDSCGQGTNCDYLNLKQDLKELGYDIKEISF